MKIERGGSTSFMMNNINVNPGRSNNFRQGYGGRSHNSSRGGGFGVRSHGHSGGRGSGGRGRGSNGGYNHSHKGSAGSYIHNIGISGNPSSTSFAVAVQGCSHGELDSIYEALKSYRRGGIKGREEGGSNSDGLVVDVESSDNNNNNNEPPNYHNNVDVLLCCGDVQTLRNADDFHSLAVPPKYKTMGDFHAYYSGQKVAPILTIMIGGNHEASNYLQELHYGGWVAPNMYYLGAAGVVNLCKKRIEEDGNVVVSVLRIAGISGIYKANHYCLGRYEMPPYDNSSLRSVYHTREVDVKRMRSLSSASLSSSSSSSSSLSPRQERTLDIIITHDWPRGIAFHGNVSQLLQQKPFFRQEVEQNELGSPAHEDLLYTLKPRYWFAAHLHVKFEAMVRHADYDSECGELQATATSTSPTTNTMSTSANSEDPTIATRITTEFIGMESNDGMCPTPSNSNIETLTEQMTRFLSLDKCLPKRRHIQITHVEPSCSRAAVASCIGKRQSTVALSINDGVCSNSCCNNPWLEYDVKWLAVLQRTHAWTKRTHGKVVVPKDNIIISKAEEDDILKRFELHSDDGEEENSATSPLAIPQNFVVTAPPFNPTTGNRTYGPPPPMIGNPQTDRLLNILGMDHQITVPFVRGAHSISPTIKHSPPNCASRQLIPSAAMYNRNSSRGFSDGNEIALDDDDDDSGVDQEKLCVEQNQMKTTGERTTYLDTINDPGMIELDELEDDGGAAGDSVCLKKPRMNS